jgi:hypothetical protein
MYEEYEEEDEGSYDSFAHPLLEPNRLSTITEKTEIRTVDSRSHLSLSPSEYAVDTSRRHLSPYKQVSARPMSSMTAMTSSTQDYGQPIRGCFACVRFLYLPLTYLQKADMHTRFRLLSVIQMLSSHLHQRLPGQDCLK